MQPRSSHLFSARAEISLPAHNLFLKNNQLDGYADHGDDRYLNRQQHHLPLPEEPPELHDKDIFAEESLKPQVSRQGVTLGAPASTQFQDQ